MEWAIKEDNNSILLPNLSATIPMRGAATNAVTENAVALNPNTSTPLPKVLIFLAKTVNKRLVPVIWKARQTINRIKNPGLESGSEPLVASRFHHMLFPL